MNHDSRPSLEQILPSVYEELRRLAAAQLSKERPGQTWQATEVAHEAYLRLASGNDGQKWVDERHFLSAAAIAIRRILVDRARAKNASKRGGEFKRLDTFLDLNVPAPEDERLLHLDEALGVLAKQRPDAAELVQLRFFAGLTLPEAASVLDLSPRTAGRIWAYAQAWLRVALSNDETASRERMTLSGWATLQLDARGEWSGQFIDSSGKHWDCRVRRVQE